MAAGEFKNPPIIDDSSGAVPANNTVLVYQASTDTWVPTAIASIGSPLTVPQTHPTEPTETAVDVATTTATNTTPWGYSTQAQANAIVTEINALVTDVATLITWADALQTKLTTAGILD